MSTTLTVERPFLTLIAMLGWLLRVHSRYALLIFKMDMHRLFGANFAVDGKRRYQEHNDWIRSLVPKDRLLELRLGRHGWEPLCSFLNVDIPSTDYPRGNTASDLNKKFNRVFWYCCRIVAMRLGTCFLALAAALYAVWLSRTIWGAQKPTTCSIGIGKA